MSELRAAAQDVHDLSRPPMRGHEWYCVPPDLMAKLGAALAATESPVAVAAPLDDIDARKFTRWFLMQERGKQAAWIRSVAPRLDDLVTVGPPLDPERLAYAINLANVEPHEVYVGTNLRPLADRIARAYRDAKP